MSALFGASSQQRSKNLVEFKAGKMTLQGRLVKPDKRKGLVYVYQSEDSLMHLCWKDRGTGTVEDVSAYLEIFYFNQYFNILHALGFAHISR